MVTWRRLVVLSADEVGHSGDGERDQAVFGRVDKSLVDQPRPDRPIAMSVPKASPPLGSVRIENDLNVARAARSRSPLPTIRSPVSATGSGYGPPFRETWRAIVV